MLLYTLLLGVVLGSSSYSSDESGSTEEFQIVFAKYIPQSFQDLFDEHGKYKVIAPYYHREPCSSDSFELIKHISSDSNGSINHSRFKSDSQEVALEYYNGVNLNSSKEMLYRLRNKEVFLYFLQHANIPKLYCSYLDGDSVVLVTEYFDGPRLSESIEENRSIPMVQMIGLGLYEALTYLHSLSIIHRNVKLENIVKVEERIVLLGFDQAIYVPEGTWGGMCGSPLMAAPEMLRGEAYDNGVDWWAYGLVLFELLTGDHPFRQSANCADWEDPALLQAVEAGIDMNREGIDEFSSDLINNICHLDPKERLSYANGLQKFIKLHAFFVYK